MKRFQQVLLTSCLLASSISYAQSFQVTSPDIKQGKLSESQVFNGFGCTGQNISPALAWKNAPKNTKSFAVTVYDPDAPTGSGWWHWVVYNIPADSQQLATGAGSENSTNLPTGAVQGRTDFGGHGFGGACPPKGHGLHRYIFTVHALKIDKLELPAEASPAMVGYMINANQIAKTSFTAKYGR